MPQEARSHAFAVGAGTAPVRETRSCAQCGYTSANNKLFRKDGDGHTCSTGHYEKDGQLKRAKNPYAKG